jgi:hypothetical protein
MFCLMLGDVDPANRRPTPVAQDFIGKYLNAL